jgi:hypothetical protein
VGLVVVAAGQGYIRPVDFELFVDQAYRPLEAADAAVQLRRGPTSSSDSWMNRRELSPTASVIPDTVRVCGTPLSSRSA